MAPKVAEVVLRDVSVPIAGGEVALAVPEEISDRTLNKEIAGQDIVRRKLLVFIDKLERLVGSNREIFICPIQKLLAVTEDFHATCRDLRKFMQDFASYTSAIPELEEARGDIRTFFQSYICEEIDKIDGLKEQVFCEIKGEIRANRRDDLKLFRSKLAKGVGVVRTELQKFFAYLLSSDPRNIYRKAGRKSQREILFLQFKRDVEVTDRLYSAVRKLDRYMRGAIVPSDLLQSTADRIERERSMACLFEQDYTLFLNALIDEIVETLLPEIESILDLDGIWYDDYESIQSKIKMLSDVCITFRVFFTERSEVREKVSARKMIYKRMEQRSRDQIYAILDVFNTHRYRDVAEWIRKIDQILVDLEATLLQWERSIAQRAFAREEWRDAEVLQRRGEKSVVYKN